MRRVPLKERGIKVEDILRSVDVSVPALGCSWFLAKLEADSCVKSVELILEDKGSELMLDTEESQGLEKCYTHTNTKNEASRE